MSTTQKLAPARLRFHPNAYQFLLAALRRTQQKLSRTRGMNPDDEQAHVSGKELLEGIREFGLEQFGMLTRTVFRCWGIQATDDFGRMVFEMIDKGDMRKTDSDQLSDFFDVYDFGEALERQYRIDVSRAF